MTSDTPPDGAQPPSSAESPSATRPIHRQIDRVVLQADVAADGRRNMSVERDGDDVVIRGHDLGPVVTRAWGSGTSEYEWIWRIPAASIPALVEALDGQPGEDALDVVRRWSMAHPGQDSGTVLKQAGVPLEFSNSVGD